MLHGVDVEVLKQQDIYELMGENDSDYFLRVKLDKSGLDVEVIYNGETLTYVKGMKTINDLLESKDVDEVTKNSLLKLGSLFFP